MDLLTQILPQCCRQLQRNGAFQKRELKSLHFLHKMRSRIQSCYELKISTNLFRNNDFLTRFAKTLPLTLGFPMSTSNRSQAFLYRSWRVFCFKNILQMLHDSCLTGSAFRSNNFFAFGKLASFHRLPRY